MSSSYYFRNQLSIKSNQQLANLLAEMILLSEKVETYRQLLAQTPFYNCLELFRLLDQGQKGYLNIQDFLTLMGHKHQKILTYLFSYFDHNKLGEITRIQFISFLIPKRNPQLREIVALAIQQPSHDLTTINQQLAIFTQLLNQMTTHQLKIIEQRKLLLQREDYSLKAVLHSIDTNAHQFITAIDVLKFLQNYAINATLQQIEDFFVIVDSKLEGKLNLESLQWIVEGLQTKNKPYLQTLKHSRLKQSQKKQSHLKQSQLKQSQVKQSHLKQSKKTQNLTTSNQQQPKDQQQPSQKQFIRTPLKSQQRNTQKQQPSSKQRNTIYYHQPNQSLQENKKYRHTSSSNTKKNNNLTQSKQTTPTIKDRQHFYETKFNSIIQRFKEAEREAVKRDAQLIRAQMEIKTKLQQQLDQLTTLRHQKLSIIDSTLRDDFTPSHRNPTYDQLYNQHLLSQISHRQYQYQNPPTLPSPIYSRDLYPPSSCYSRYRTMQSFYPSQYESIYDKKINTIVQNFYKRNPSAVINDRTTYDSLNKPNYIDRPSHQPQPRSSSLYDRNKDPYNRFLQDQVYISNKIRQRQTLKYQQRQKVKPFSHHRDILLKDSINKKLGDQLFNIRLSTQRNHPSSGVKEHNNRQNNHTYHKGTIKTNEIQQKNMPSSSASPKMLQNISIISKDTPSIKISSSKPSPQNYNLVTPNGNPSSSLSSNYQTVQSQQPQTSNQKDLVTTVSKGQQSGLKQQRKDFLKRVTRQL